MKFSKKDIFTIPNILTYIRIVCVPFFIWFILDKSIPNNLYIAFGIFIFASITDMVDGFIARHYHLISDIGKVADPIADKLLQVSTLVCLTILGKIALVFPIIFFIKEAYMGIGGSVIVKIFKSDYVLQSNIFGKAATCLNSLGIVLGFFAGEVNRAYDIAVNVILACGAVFAICTAVIYTMQFFKFRKRELNEKRIKAVADSDLQSNNQDETIDVIVETEIKQEADTINEETIDAKVESVNDNNDSENNDSEKC